MDSDASTWDHQPGKRPQPPAPLLIAALFRVVGASERPLRCATYRVAYGVEFRIEYEDREDVLRTQLFKPHEEEAIEETAAAWRAAFDGRGFTELALE